MATGIEDGARRMIMGGEISGGSALTTVCAMRRDIRFGPAHVDAVLEINIGDAAAEVRVTMDVLDAFYRRGQKAFEQIGDAPFHLLRQQAGVDPDHGGDGNRDIREDIGRHVEHRLVPNSTIRMDMTTKVYGLSQGDEDDLVHARILPKDICLSVIASKF